MSRRRIALSPEDLIIAGPLAAFVVCLFSGILVPVPEDGITLFLGYLIGEGELPAFPTVVAATLGIFGRDCLAFGLGHGARRLAQSRKSKDQNPNKRLATATRLAKRFGKSSLYLARFAVGLRMGLYVAAGVAGHTWKRFLVYEAIAVPIVVPGYLWMGSKFGADALIVLKTALPYLPALFVGLIVILTVGFYFRKRTGKAEETNENEVADHFDSERKAS